MVIVKLLNKARSYSTEIVIFSFFAFLSLLVSFPTILYLKTYAYAQLPGDTHAGLWNIWWEKFSRVSNLPYEFCQILRAPFGMPMYLWAAVAISFPIFLLSLFFDEISSYNVLAIAAFSLSAITMFYLMHHLTKNKLASMISGIIYAFSPYHFAQSYAHIELSNIQWMPLYILFLFKFYEERTLRNALLCGLFFSLVVLENGYYAFFMLIFTIVFLLFIFFRNIIRQRKFSFYIHRWKLLVLSIIFSFALVAPFVLPAAFRQYAGPSPHLTALWEVESQTATFWNYLLPAPDNPIFGSLVQDFVYTKTGGRYPVNHVDYLGYVPVALAILALVGWQRRRFTQDDKMDEQLRWGIPFLVFAFLVAVIVSAPPSMKLFDAKVLMPSYYLHEIAPMFRAFIRFGIMAMLALSMLAGIGAKFLLENISSAKNRLLVTLLIVVLILMEFINVPPSKATDVSSKTVPAVYKWLASQSGDFTIVEYPAPVKMPHKFYEYMFYQRIHRKRLADPRRIPSLEGKDYLFNLLRPGAASVLRYLGVKYVIVHTDEYRGEGGSVVTLTKEHGLRLVKTFPDTLVYEVAAKPSKVLWIPEEGVFAPEFWGGWENYREWKWMTNEARLLAVNFSGRGTYGNLRFSAAALGYPRVLRVYLNGRFVKETKIPPTAKELVVEDVYLKAGENVLAFSTSSAPEPIDSFLQNGDVRSATFMLSEFKFEN